MLLGRVEMLKRRRTKIVATVGPSSSDAATLERLLAAGVNVVRLNMSHGDHEAHAQAYKEVRAAEAAAGVPVAVLADLCGPKLRVGKFDGGGIDLEPGAVVVVTTRDVVGGPGLIPSQYPTLHSEVRPGARILLDDGQLELRVLSVSGTEIECEVVRGGRLKDRKGMNLPDTTLSTPALTDKDREDAKFVLGLGVDYLALSFVRRAADVLELRALLPSAGSGLDAPLIIAKIEHPDALEEIEAIVDAADGVMVARGDLGVELPPEDVPVIQRELVRLARACGKPCIVATQMLESMIEHAQPTRAEVSDVSTAVFSGTDAVMLSAETASGRYPVEAVTMMDRIARKVEGYLFSQSGFFGPEPPSEGSFLEHELPLREAVALATAQLSRDLRVRAVVALSASGTTARALAAARPAAPVVAVSPHERTARALALVWGVAPVHLAGVDGMATADVARQVTGEQGLTEAESGHRVLTVAGLAGDGTGTDVPTVSVLTV
ncbi:MAG TPA: pyruvate kinase [Acidimicrobiales bacterium]|nr:pyruvate kinase [Acidimicrobiales bacterium]